jgi:hypothetical protein
MECFDVSDISCVPSYAATEKFLFLLKWRARDSIKSGSKISAISVFSSLDRSHVPNVLFRSPGVLE